MTRVEFKNVHHQSAKNQYFAALVSNLLTIGYGLIAGWSSSSVILLTSDETPLPSGKISMEEASWITSLMGLGGLVANIPFGFMMEPFGRKIPLLFVAMLSLISWLLILFAQNAYYLYVARLLHGLTIGGVLLVNPIYLIEIADDSIRGSLVSSVPMIGHAGLVLAFVFGNYCSFHTPPIVMIVLSVVFIVVFFFFPETPTFLVKQNKIFEAEKSVRFYRSIQDYELLQSEMDKIKCSVGDTKNKEKDENPFKWSLLMKKPGSKAMTIGIVLAILTQFSGCFALVNYAAHFFKLAGSSLSPNLSAIVVGVIQLCGTISMVFLVDRVGRKLLCFISTTGATFGYIVLGVYLMLESWQYNVEDFSWIPVVTLSFILFVASLAISSMSFTVVAEVMPEPVKDFGITFCVTLISLGAFITLKFLPLMIELIGLHGCMFVFAGVCVSCELYIIFCMPETKGKSHNEIMHLLQK